MGWRDRIKHTGSFKGAPFFLDMSEDERAFRKVVHEFPGRDKPYIENLGKKSIPFTIDVLLIGDDCLEQRDNLQVACSSSGSGPLVHPHYGDIQVECLSIKTRHDRNELGVVRATLQFIEVGDLQPFVAVVDTRAKVEISALSVIQGQKSEFEKAFDFAQIPYLKAKAAQDEVNRGIEAIGKARQIVSQAPAFRQQLQNIGGSISALIYSAEALAQGVIDLVTFGFLTPDVDRDGEYDVKQSFNELIGLFAFRSAAFPASAQADSFGHLICGVALAQGGHLISTAEFSSFEDAIELRDILFEHIDAYQEIEGLPDEVFVRLSDLRAQVERDINERSAQLPRVIEMTLPKAIPALVLSYRLYGHLDMEENLVARNGVRHPGFMPSNRPIKVVSGD